MKKLALMIILMLNFLSFASGAEASASTNSITASGHGEIEIPQEIAIMELAVNETGKKPQQVEEQARVKVNQLQKMLKTLPTIAIATSVVSVSPIWSYTNNQSKITGYTANYTLQVKSTITASGAIIDKAIQNGASIVNNPQLTASDKARANAQLEAIKLATQDAKAKALASLSALGLTAKTVRQITVQGSNFQLRPLQYSMLKVAANDAVPATQILPGTDIISADVTISMDY